MPYTTDMFIPVAGLPIKGPQLSLLASAASPTAEGTEFPLDVEQISHLPDELAAELRARSGAAWTRGFQYAPDPTVVDNSFTPPNLPLVTVQPWITQTKYTCSPFGFEEIDYVGRAKRQNDLAVPAAIEQEFMDGTLTRAYDWGNHFLRDAATVQDVTPTPGTAVDITKGLGLLQDALRNGNGGVSGTGGQGMIHCIPAAVPNLLNVRRLGKLMLDIFDNLIVPGVGYSGLPPIGTNAVAGTTWMYATDMVAVRVEADATVIADTWAETFDWGQNGNPNTETMRAERFVCAYWDVFRHYGCLVSLPS
jgi:hypothetical protein